MPENRIISTRIRFARNIKDYPFPRKCNEAIAKEICEKTASVFPDAKCIYFDKLSPMEAASMYEKNIISREFALSERFRCLISLNDEKTNIMVMEEDHIREQYISSNETLSSCFENLSKTDAQIRSSLRISYDKKYGFLTECPTNLGSGMRASAMVFLPALESERKISQLKRELEGVGLTLRGSNGESSESHGALYQISNQITLGPDEKTVISRLERYLQSICETEKKAEDQIFLSDKTGLEDIVMRAFGTALYAKRIGTEEFYDLYKKIKLGSLLGILDVPSESLDHLMFEVQPNTIELRIKENDSEKRDELRANIIRESIN